MSEGGYRDFFWNIIFGNYFSEKSLMCPMDLWSHAKIWKILEAAFRPKMQKIRTNDRTIELTNYYASLIFEDPIPIWKRGPKSIHNKLDFSRMRSATAVFSSTHQKDLILWQCLDIDDMDCPVNLARLRYLVCILKPALHFIEQHHCIVSFVLEPLIA